MAGMQYSSNTWATYKQISEAGGNVRKGEKGTHIVFFKPMTKETQTASGQIEKESFAVIKSYCVFNASQCDGLELPTPAAEPAEFTAIELAEQRIAKTGAIVSHGGDAAFYMPSADRIQLPNKATFETPASYYATVFHELTHWSGADHRLARDLSKGRFGNPAYAFEELVAELGAAFLCQDHAIDGELRHAGYIASWLKALRDDKTAIFKAAALAQKAADYVNQLDATAASIAA
jgi:antirestriction protein ArdC